MPNHKRKDTDKKDRGNYPRHNLLLAVEDVLKGICSPPDAQTKYGVPAKTIRKWVNIANKQAKEQGIDPLDVEIKDFDGPQRAISRREEDFLKNFVEDTEEIGVPRCKARLAVDIQQYVRKEKKKTPFTNDKPGDGYFERFCSDVDGRPCLLKTPAYVNAFMDREVIVDKWIGGVKEYFKKYNGHLLKDKRLLFVLETQVFKTTTKPIRHMSVVMIYNGCGDIIRWLIVTDRHSVTEDFPLEPNDNLMLLKTDDGKLSWTVLKSSFVLISRDVRASGNGETAVVFMDQFIQQHLNYIVWKYTLSEGLYVIAIPRRLCNGQRTFNFGGMAKYNFQMLFLIFQRFVNLGFTMDEKDFIYLHTQEMFCVPFRATLLASNRFLKLNKVVGRTSPLKNTDDQDQDDAENSIPLVPVTNTPATVEKPKKTIPSSKGSKKKPKQHTSDDGTSNRPIPTAVAPTTPSTEPQTTIAQLPALLVHTCTVATQTAESSFEQDKYADARKLCLDNTVMKEQDFAN